MFRIKLLLLLAIICISAASQINGQTLPVIPHWIQGTWEAGCSWEHDTTMYSVRFDLTSVNNYRLSVMDEKVRLGLKLTSASSNHLEFFVDLRISDLNPIFAGAHVTIDNVSQYIYNMNYIAIKFEGSDEVWSGILLKIR